MNRFNTIRVIAAKLASAQPQLAFELNEALDQLDKGSEPTVTASTGKYAKLKSVVIRKAASDPQAKAVLRDVLAEIKELG